MREKTYKRKPTLYTIMNIDKIISHLEGKISETEFKERVEKKIEEFGGLLTREGATLIVASELGIPIEMGKTDSFDISSIVEGLASVSVVGIVSDIFPLREFSRNNATGKVASVTLADKTGSIRTVFWNEDAERISEIKRGDVLEIFGGYVKRGLYGLELHVGRRGRILINPRIEKELPEITDGPKKISQLIVENEVTVTGVVMRLFGMREFKKEDNVGHVSSLTLRDETGEIRVSLWGDKAELVQRFSPGDVVRIEGGYTKQGLTGLELHVGMRGNIIPSDEKINISVDEENSTTVRTGGIAVSGVVSGLGDTRAFQRSDSTTGRVSSLLVENNGEAKRVVLWNEKCDLVPFLCEGMHIDIQNAYTREGQDGIEIHVGASGFIQKLGTEPEKGIHTLSGPCEIKGRVTSVNPLVVCNGSGSCELIAEGAFTRGDLLLICGEFREGKLFAQNVKGLEEKFPSLEDIENPPRKSISSCRDGDFVLIVAFLKKKFVVGEHYLYLIDDGEGEITGVGFDNLTVGKEYIFKVLIREGIMKEFVAYASEEVSYAEALKGMIERIGELIEV
jgi:ssDNA-binding replication factor A large subunit